LRILAFVSGGRREHRKWNRYERENEEWTSWMKGGKQKRERQRVSEAHWRWKVESEVNEMKEMLCNDMMAIGASTQVKSRDSPTSWKFWKWIQWMLTVLHSQNSQLVGETRDILMDLPHLTKVKFWNILFPCACWCWCSSDLNTKVDQATMWTGLQQLPSSSQRPNHSIHSPVSRRSSKSTTNRNCWGL
jgi:hypothetical protein